jgi:uncharacterized protein
MWIPDETLQEWDASVRPRGSAITHFHEKLLKLAGGMNTETARRWAAARHAFVERFLEEFLAEWDGNPSRNDEEAQ